MQYVYEICPRCKAIPLSEEEGLCHMCLGEGWILIQRILSQAEYDKENENGEQ